MGLQPSRPVASPRTGSAAPEARSAALAAGRVRYLRPRPPRRRRLGLHGPLRAATRRRGWRPKRRCAAIGGAGAATGHDNRCVHQRRLLRHRRARESVPLRMGRIGGRAAPATSGRLLPLLRADDSGGVVHIRRRGGSGSIQRQPARARTPGGARPRGSLPKTRRPMGVREGAPASAARGLWSGRGGRLLHVLDGRHHGRRSRFHLGRRRWRCAGPRRVPMPQTSMVAVLAVAPRRPRLRGLHECGGGDGLRPGLRLGRQLLGRRDR
mmetsp:Transcript_49030/g.142763  ORF Transcript_49030/g.142763 Transcript_49030/m.142763 type:complete len:267 (+) Transcript_49030:416-1216(+)